MKRKMGLWNERENRNMFDYKERMDTLLKQEVATGSVKGASALVLYQGKEIYQNQFGFADAEKEIPMKRDTIIRLFSMTKPITSAAVMLLVERGELDVWDAVSRYFPCFAGRTVWDAENGKEVPADREITVWDLLNMTSGIPYPNEETEPGRRMQRVLDGLIERRKKGERVDTGEYVCQIATVPLEFQPGDRWLYGFSADVLGGIVEVVSGKTFGSFLREELFEPLGMKDTGFFVPREKLGRFAQSYERTGDGLLPNAESHLGEYYGEDVAFESGGAGLVSTLDDYSRFASMLTHKGFFEGKQILGEKTVEFMTQNRLSPYQGRTLTWDSVRGYGYGCLMRVLMDQGIAGTNASPGEFGWDGWTGNYVTMNRKEDLVFLYFIQRRGAGMTPVVRRLRSVTYAALSGLDRN